MQMKPLDKYQDPQYPRLCAVEKIIHLNASSGKKAATLAMAVATALSLTTCNSATLASGNGGTAGSTKSTQSNSSGNVTSTDTIDLTHATDEGFQTYVTTAGVALIEETTETSQTVLAGDILSTADETTCTTYGPEIAGSIAAPEDTTYPVVD